MEEPNDVERALSVSRMFGRIAPNYDRLNSIMSLGRHHKWRQVVADTGLSEVRDQLVLDVATGTGDLAIELAGRPEVSSVIGIDFTRQMLDFAMVKTRYMKLNKRINYLECDAHNLPFSNDQFTCVTVGFGMRNFVDPRSALDEMVRVVRPGGRIVILEIVRHQMMGGIGIFIRLGFRLVTPWLGAIFAGNREAYSYLPRSAAKFLSADELTVSMKAAGLVNVKYCQFAFGAVAIHVGEKVIGGA